MADESGQEVDNVVYLDEVRDRLRVKYQSLVALIMNLDAKNSYNLKDVDDSLRRLNDWFVKLDRIVTHGEQK